MLSCLSLSHGVGWLISDGHVPQYLFPRHRVDRPISDSYTRVHSNLRTHSLQSREKERDRERVAHMSIRKSTCIPSRRSRTVLVTAHFRSLAQGRVRTGPPCALHRRYVVVCVPFAILRETAPSYHPSRTSQQNLVRYHLRTSNNLSEPFR